MKRHATGWIDNIVFALASFIFFLLLFESKLVVPVWLQPLGRMHPLMLHFPIVLVLLAMFMEFFRGRPQAGGDVLYERFVTGVLLGGLVTSGVTVVMGIFLSLEGGYGPESLAWHKWTAVVMFYLACAVYACRNAAWYGRTVARGLAVATSVTVIVAGHFGAVLTHGDDFVLQPVLAQQHEAPVAPEEARAFAHVIKPILESKCASCHNAGKLKGELVLTDSASLSRGGKSGGLLVAGKPDESLLIERIRLPDDHKEHMPPPEKPQLTAEERSLLYAWIESGAPFSKRLLDLPKADSFRSVALAALQADEPPGEVFSFPAVAEETLEALNSNYRVVRPVALNSPALAVNIYNRSAFNDRTLRELQEIKRQVISLQVSKMPVTDEALKDIAKFENLRTLNLNFTAITGDGLAALTTLKELRMLSLAGTKVTYRDVREVLPRFQKLNAMALWNTSLTVEEIKELQDEFRHVSVYGAFAEEHAEPIKLNAPRLQNKTIVFDDSIAVALSHPVPGVDIRYTLDGTEPDSLSGKLFSGSAVVRQTTAIQARAYKAGWLTSDPVTLHVYRRGHAPDTAVLLSRLNRVHTAKGAQTFFDYALGSFNANSPAWANNWAGVINNDLELLLYYDEPRPVSSVSLNTLIETETFLFPPAVIEVWGGSAPDDLKLLGRAFPEMPSEYRKPFIRLFDCEFDAARVSCLKVVARPVMKLPAWHKRKGRPALLLVDEILIN